MKSEKVTKPLSIPIKLFNAELLLSFQFDLKLQISTLTFTNLLKHF